MLKSCQLEKRQLPIRRHTGIPAYRRTIWDFAFPVLKRLTLTLYIIYIIIYIIYNINLYYFSPSPLTMRLCQWYAGTSVRRYAVCLLAARRFYSYYPQIGELLESRICQTSDKLIVPCSISATLSPKSEKSATSGKLPPNLSITQQLAEQLGITPQAVEQFSITHVGPASLRALHTSLLT